MSKPKYIAISYFEDLQDNGVAYEPYTVYPRDGLEVSDSRLEALSSYDNKLGKPVIKELKHVESDAVEEAKAEDEPVDYNDLTVSELKEEADARGLDYDPKAKKQELVELLSGRD